MNLFGLLNAIWYWWWVSVNSSNSNRLRELAERTGSEAHLVVNADDIKPEWWTGKSAIGITAGASAPDVLVQGVIGRLTELGADMPEELDGKAENVVFTMPKELRLKAVGD